MWKVWQRVGIYIHAHCSTRYFLLQRTIYRLNRATGSCGRCFLVYSIRTLVFDLTFASWFYVCVLRVKNSGSTLYGFRESPFPSLPLAPILASRSFVCKSLRASWSARNLRRQRWYGPIRDPIPRAVCSFAPKFTLIVIWLTPEFPGVPSLWFRFMPLTFRRHSRRSP